MKTIISTLTAVFVAGILTAQITGVQPILDNYLKVKDALVLSDVKKTSEYTGDFIAAINKTESAELKAKEKASFVAVKDKLLKTAQKMSKTDDIEKQRKTFAELSLLMWKLVKDAESVTQEVFYQYCPMKKFYWLSNEAIIKNPYYGSQMLSCGNVSDKRSK